MNILILCEFENKINYAFFKFHFEHDDYQIENVYNNMHTHTYGQKEKVLNT